MAWRLRVRCPRCGYEASDPLLPRCPRCGSPLYILPGEAVWRVDKSEPTMWRYSTLLPKLPARVSFGEGYTPLRRLAPRLYVKLEARNPTGSYADRASAVIASYLHSTGWPGSVLLRYEEDFTVSLAYYLSGYTRVRVYADPHTSNPLDLIALARLGVEISFAEPPPDAALLEYENPLTVEGLKTIAFEVVEAQPSADTIYAPAVSGMLAVSIAKGVWEAARAGANAGYEVVAVTVEGAGDPPLVRLSPWRVRVERVEAREAMEALVELARLGLRVKPLTAAAYAAAKSAGSGVAVLTGQIAAKPPRLGGVRGRLAVEARRAVESMGEATAYQVWERLGKRYSLRGVYKALEALEASGMLCSKYVMRGRRRVKVYHPCSTANT